MMVVDFNGALLDFSPKDYYYTNIDRFGNIELWERSDKKVYEVADSDSSCITIHVTNLKDKALQIFNQLKNGTAKRQ